MSQLDRKLTPEERRRLVETPIKLDIHPPKSHAGHNFAEKGLGYGGRRGHLDNDDDNR